MVFNYLRSFRKYYVLVSVLEIINIGRGLGILFLKSFNGILNEIFNEIFYLLKNFVFYKVRSFILGIVREEMMFVEIKVRKVN